MNEDTHILKQLQHTHNNKQGKSESRSLAPSYVSKLDDFESFVSRAKYPALPLLSKSTQQANEGAMICVLSLVVLCVCLAVAVCHTQPLLSPSVSHYALTTSCNTLNSVSLFLNRLPQKAVAHRRPPARPRFRAQPPPGCQLSRSGFYSTWPCGADMHASQWRRERRGGQCGDGGGQGTEQGERVCCFCGYACVCLVRVCAVLFQGSNVNLASLDTEQHTSHLNMMLLV